MRRCFRLPMLAILALAVMAVATSGVAQAAWVWCDDPVLSVGNDKLGYTTIYVVYAIDSDDEASTGELSDRFAPALRVEVPKGVNINVVDSQGWQVRTGTDSDLKVKSKAIQAEMDILVMPKTPSFSDDDTKVKIRVSLDPLGKRVIGIAVGEVGENIELKVNIPAGYGR